MSAIEDSRERRRAACARYFGQFVRHCFGLKVLKEAGSVAIHRRIDNARLETGSLRLIVDALTSASPELYAFASFASLCMIGR